jgi:hypothetical protein
VVGPRANAEPGAHLLLHEIREAIDACERFLLVFGPHAGSSKYVVAEWQHAVAYGKPISLVLRLGDYESLPDELRLLHAEDFRDDRDYKSHFEHLMPGGLGRRIR